MLAPREQAGPAVAIDVSPTTVTVGTTQHIRGTGCLDPTTHTGTGLQAAYELSTDDTPATWPLQHPSATTSVAADGTFEWTRIIGQPLPLTPQNLKVACGVGDRQVAVYPAVLITYDLPSWTFPATAEIGGSASFTAPCGVPATGQLVLTFTHTGVGGPVGAAVVPGPVIEGATATVTIPSRELSPEPSTPLPPGSYEVALRCDVSGPGSGGATFGAVPVTLTSTPTTPSTPPPPATPTVATPTFTG